VTSDDIRGGKSGTGENISTSLFVFPSNHYSVIDSLWKKWYWRRFLSEFICFPFLFTIPLLIRCGRSGTGEDFSPSLFVFLFISLFRHRFVVEEIVLEKISLQVYFLSLSYHHSFIASYFSTIIL
jgi:hypothetical protein